MCLDERHPDDFLQERQVLLPVLLDDFSAINALSAVVVDVLALDRSIDIYSLPFLALKPLHRHCLVLNQLL